MKKRSVSVSIVTYNDYDSVVTTLEGLYDYFGGELTVYVIDNCSPDGTGARISARFPDVQFIQNEKNVGFGAAHNAVIPLLKSDYHAVINPDIVFTSDVLTPLCAYLDGNPDIGLIVPKIVSPDGDEQPLPRRNPTFAALVGRRVFKKALKKHVERYIMANEDLSDVTDVESASGCFMVLRTELFRSLGGFDERFFMYLEDNDLTRRVCGVSRAVYYPFAEVCHAWTRSSAHSLKYFLILIVSAFKYFKKWGFELK